MIITPTDAQLSIIAEQLGRTPRGALEIAYTTPDDQPAVVKTASKLDNGTPFPTLLLPRRSALDSRSIASRGGSGDEVDGIPPQRRHRGRGGPTTRLPRRLRTLPRKAQRYRGFGHRLLRRRHAGACEMPLRGSSPTRLLKVRSMSALAPKQWLWQPREPAGHRDFGGLADA